MSNDVTASIGARITDFTRKMKQVTNSIKRVPNRVNTQVTARTQDFHSKMDSLANKIRVVGTVAGSVFKGGMLAVLPALAPIIASLTGGIGGLATSLAAAGTGAIMFGSVATSALNDVFQANSDIKKLREELANTSDLEKRAQILQQIKQAQAGLTKEQQRGLKALQSFSKFWGGFAKQFQKPVMDIFIRSLGQLKGLIKTLEPAFQGAVKAFDGLSVSMGKAFKSEDMQKFFAFLNKSAGPAITALGKSFGNVMRGIMNLMTAFAPLSVDMQGGLVKLTDKFAKWTSTLSESKAFQNFVNYVKENGPKVISLIGNLTTFLIELGKGMAPLGSFILDVVNGFLQWTNSMSKAHPWFAKVMAGVTSVIGVLVALTPAIALAQSAFGGMATFIMARTAMMRAKVLVGIKMMITSLGKFVAKMAVMTAQMVVQSAKFIARWALMGAKSLLHAAKVAAAFVVAMGPVGWVIATVVALVALIIANWSKVKSWTKAAWSATVNFVKDAWSKIWGKTKEVVASVVAKVASLKEKVASKFEAMKSAISEKMTAAWNKIESIWESVMSFFRGINLFDMGADIIQGLINGIGSMASALVKKAKGVVDGAISGAKSLLGIKSPSRVFRQIGIYTGQGMVDGMKKMNSKVATEAKNMAKAAVPKIGKVDVGSQLKNTIKSGRIQATVNGGAVQTQGSTAMLSLLSSINEGIRDGKVIELDGRQMGRTLERHVTKEQNRQRDRIGRFDPY